MDHNFFCRRREIASILKTDTDEEVLIAGRVLLSAPENNKFLLADETGECWCHCSSMNPPLKTLPLGGDVVAVWGELVSRETSQYFSVGNWQMLTAYQSSKPFLSPGGEYFRLHQAVQPRFSLLRKRSLGLQAIRNFFARRDFIEVQTPKRVRHPGLEPHLRPLPSGKEHYLITSPEYQMKRLLAGGLERIYFMGSCWRDDELGLHHLSEFCMLEWYRAYCDLETLMQDTEDLVVETAAALGHHDFLLYQGRRISLSRPFPRLTFAEAFAKYAGIDLRQVTDVDELRRRALKAGFGPFSGDCPFEEITSRVLIERIEPTLAASDAFIFLHDFPAPLSALARLKESDPTVAERFELYAGGLELANAFFELTDEKEQRKRLLSDQKQRREEGAEVYSLDEKFLAALAEGLPPSAGNALGVDRLLMLLLDVSDINQLAAISPAEL